MSGEREKKRKTETNQKKDELLIISALRRTCNPGGRGRSFLHALHLSKSGVHCHYLKIWPLLCANPFLFNLTGKAQGSPIKTLNKLSVVFLSVHLKPTLNFPPTHPGYGKSTPATDTQRWWMSKGHPQASLPSPTAIHLCVEGTSSQGA